MPFGQIKYTKSSESVAEWQGYAIISRFQSFSCHFKVYFIAFIQYLWKIAKMNSNEGY